MCIIVSITLKCVAMVFDPIKLHVHVCYCYTADTEATASHIHLVEKHTSPAHHVCLSTHHTSFPLYATIVGNWLFGEGGGVPHMKPCKF